MKNLVIPEVEPLEYAGQKVLTTRQLNQTFGCSRQTVDGIFRNHIKEFEIGVDYFKLVGEELRNFKLECSRKINLLAAGKQACLPFSNFASCLYLWTESGVEKLSQFIGTDNAKFICAAFKFGYFQKTELPPTRIKTLPQFSTREKYHELKFLIANCKDESLRDNLIKAAFALLNL